MHTADAWADWLQDRRYGSDPDWKQRTLAWLGPIRDRVIALASIAPGETVLDVGSGEGLIGFAALEHVGAHGSVVFSDISRDLLGSCARVADSLGVADRCTFVHASATQLDDIDSHSVDVVATRSVLIYVDDKAAAFAEFFRVLRPGGRMALFEPINQFGHPEPEHLFWGYDVRAVQSLATRVRSVLDQEQAAAGALTMTDFDERDLVGWVEEAGFATISLCYEVTISAEAGLAGITWDAFRAFAPNPLCPTVGEAMERSLTMTEQGEFERHLRPPVESGRGSTRSAVAYLAATKPASGMPATWSRATGS